MDQKEYDKVFGYTNDNSDRLKNAFYQVSDIRKFEIELYWKRAGYFWAIIVLAFTGFFTIIPSGTDSNDSRSILSFIVSSIGFILTFAWHLANKGSKYWQENWEDHLDLLEDKVTGPLYKTVLERNEIDYIKVNVFNTDPARISVSKINQCISLYLLAIWLLLALYTLNESKILSYFTLDIFYFIIFNVFVVVSLYLLRKYLSINKEIIILVLSISLITGFWGLGKNSILILLPLSIIILTVYFCYFMLTECKTDTHGLQTKKIRGRITQIKDNKNS